MIFRKKEEQNPSEEEYTDITETYPETDDTSVGHIVWPIILALAAGGILLIKSRPAAINYLYALIPLLTGISLIGTYVYNRGGNMKIFSSAAMLTVIGTALQILIDQNYYPPNSFSLIKMIIGIVIAIIFVGLYSLFRKLLNKSFTVYLMMFAAAAIYIILIWQGSDPNGYGTKAWISISGYTIQLTDFTKIAAVMFYSALFSSSTSRDDHQILVLSSIFFLINLLGSLLIRELGSFFILFFLHLSILYIFMQKGTVKRTYLLTIFILAAGAVILSFLAWRILYPSHEAGTMGTLATLVWPYINKIHTRFSITANINSDPYGAGYQLLQGKKALWLAGWFGNSVNFNAIPVVESDMAFIGLVNSFGLPIGFFTIFLFCRIMQQGGALSRKLMKREKQDAIVVFGATVLIFLQAMIVIFGSCNVIPFTGLPIPFLSRGGTYQALVFCFIGVLLHMSEENEDDYSDGGEM